ncbi:MAG TPA: GNAT family N-acetyltransferase [Actinomycetota bacterium]|nr:GNAT family N-acetyltransferase [Actinomycetota bacterium]
MSPLEAPPGYRAERPSRTDLEAIAEILVACDIEEVGHPDFLDGQWLEEEWDVYPVDLGSNAWVARDEQGRAAAYAHIVEEIPGITWEAVGWVHPHDRSRGLGLFLVRATEQDAGAKLSGASPLNLHHIASGWDAAAGDLLRAAGFEPTRYFWHMELSLGAERPRPPTPPDVEITPFLLEQDEGDVHSVLEIAFEKHWGAAPIAFEKWLQESVQMPWFDPSLWFVARSKGEIVGVLVGRIEHGRGFVDDLGVLEAQRGRGIGAALLDTSFTAFEERGLSLARLNVDAANETGAVRLYERVGMKPVRAWVVFAKEIGAAE